MNVNTKFAISQKLLTFIHIYIIISGEVYEREASEMTLGEKIRLLRESRSMSQDELAGLLGYTDRSSVAKIETDKIDLKRSKILLLSEIFNVNPVDLCLDADDSLQYSALSPDEAQLIEYYRIMTQEYRAHLLASAAGFAQLGQQKNNALSELEKAN